MLVLGGHFEVAENYDEHEDVVHAQADFNEVAGEPLERGFVAHVMKHDAIESHREGEPHGAPSEGFLYADDMGFFLENPQIERKHRGDKSKEASPGP